MKSLRKSFNIQQKTQREINQVESERRISKKIQYSGYHAQNTKYRGYEIWEDFINQL